MPVETYWLEEPILFYQKLSGHLDADGVRQAFDASINLATQSPLDKVHLLLDMRELKSVPPDIPLLVGQTRRVQNSKIDQFAILGASRLLKFLMEVVSHTTPFHYRTFETYEQAMAFLQEIIARDRQIARLQPPDTEDAADA